MIDETVTEFAKAWLVTKEQTDICLCAVCLAKTTALANTVFLHFGVFVGTATKTPKTKG